MTSMTIMTATMPAINAMTEMTDVKLVDRAVMSPCSLPMAASWGTGLSASESALLLPVIPARVRDERPTEASAAAVVKAQAPAYAFATVAEGAGADGASGTEGANGHANGQQKKTQHGMRAFRGLEPWSDPA